MDFDHPPAEPLGAMKLWLKEAEATGLPNPNAMTLATTDTDGSPSARIVLLKGLDERGAVFFTNYQSRKGEALAAEARAALLFHWDVINRQLRIEGRASKVSAEESDAYFAGRPRGSQIGAWASAQSQPIASRAALEAAVREVEARFTGRDVPRPPHWGGYRVSLDRIEFWQGDPLRVHDRVLYTSRPGTSWQVQRLAP
jgi:pyridoxamine 5'-phosphate oxidase